MSADGDATAPHEIVIIKRRGGGEDEGHHGGAWKIAFADLMTAMMAFFLVMWLISVSDKEQIAGVASYFNPSRSSARTPMTKGLMDPGKKPAESFGADPSAKSQPDDISKSDHAQDKVKKAGDGTEVKGDSKSAEEELFNDPFGVLGKMAVKALSKGEKANGGKMDVDSLLAGGEAYRNPFDPYGSQSPVLEPRMGGPVSQGLANPLAPGVPGAAALDAPKIKPIEEEEDPAEEDAADDLEMEIMKSVANLSSDRMPTIEVTKADGGLLVSLTDDFSFGMFQVSSAAPVPEMVVVMEKVAKAIAAFEGRIIVRGHTDGRPFTSGKNDNWRLSMARAQIAYYMLVRGGIDESRFDAIEGHADRNLKIGSDPYADQNRRIEILLKASQP
jgi:chemotaxis protein MotB